MLSAIRACRDTVRRASFFRAGTLKGPGTRSQALCVARPPKPVNSRHDGLKRRVRLLGLAAIRDDLQRLAHLVDIAGQGNLRRAVALRDSLLVGVEIFEDDVVAPDIEHVALTGAGIP